MVQLVVLCIWFIALIQFFDEASKANAQPPRHIKAYLKQLRDQEKNSNRLPPVNSYPNFLQNRRPANGSIQPPLRINSDFKLPQSNSAAIDDASKVAVELLRKQHMANIDPNRKFTGRRAIVTFLCGGTEALNAKYARFLRAFAHTLRSSGYADELLVLYTNEYPLPKISETVKKFNIVLQKVTQMSIPITGHRYEHMLTKLHIFNLVQYDQLMYFDTDFIFQKNPAPAFLECGPMAPLCAVHDQGINDFRTGNNKYENYFNAGFLVIAPNALTYQELVRIQGRSVGYRFVEQDLLNEFFKNNWKPLDTKYNLMHCYRQKSIPSHVVAIHEKLHELKKFFPDKQYVWNQNFRKK
jgi:hypothetical protein